MSKTIDAGFRKYSGREIYCAMLSFIETMELRGIEIIDAILGLLTFLSYSISHDRG